MKESTMQEMKEIGGIFAGILILLGIVGLILLVVEYVVAELGELYLPFLSIGLGVFLIASILAIEKVHNSGWL